MKSRPGVRTAYVRAEVATALAHQIRANRLARGWKQSDLAKALKTTQAAVSRLEDPSYGRISLSTLMDLAEVFDAGLEVRFVSLVKMLKDTFHPNAEGRVVKPFEAEAEEVGFEYKVAVRASIPSARTLLLSRSTVPQGFTQVFARSAAEMVGVK